MKQWLLIVICSNGRAYTACSWRAVLGWISCNVQLRGCWLSTQTSFDEHQGDMALPTASCMLLNSYFQVYPRLNYALTAISVLKPFRLGWDAKWSRHCLVCLGRRTLQGQFLAVFDIWMTAVKGLGEPLAIFQISLVSRCGHFKSLGHFLSDYLRTLLPWVSKSWALDNVPGSGRRSQT